LSKNPAAIDILKEHPHNIDWFQLGYNTAAIKLFEENPDKICSYSLSSNPKAIPLLEKNMNKIDWRMLSANPNAMDLLEKNTNKINYQYLSSNPSIFTYDYDLIKETFKDLNEEVVIKALHPKRIIPLMELYGEEEILSCYFDEE
jgi:hypothetical protein